MRVLVVGRQPAMMERALALVAEAGHDGVGVLTDDDARAALAAGGVHALLIGGGVEPGSRSALTALAGSVTPEVRVVDVYGPHRIGEALAALG